MEKDLGVASFLHHERPSGTRDPFLTRCRLRRRTESCEHEATELGEAVLHLIGREVGGQTRNLGPGIEDALLHVGQPQGGAVEPHMLLGRLHVPRGEKRARHRPVVDVGVDNRNLGLLNPPEIRNPPWG